MNWPVGKQQPSNLMLDDRNIHRNDIFQCLLNTCSHQLH